MSIQSEQQLENELIAQLESLGFSRVVIRDEAQLLANLKSQIEQANGLASLSETEWKQVISFLNNEPYRVCRRPTFLRECPDEKSKIHP